MSNEQSTGTNAPHQLIVNYLPQLFDERMLFGFFSAIGQVVHCKLMKDNNTGYSYGFGFITYANPEDAERAIEQYDGFQIENKRIKVALSRPGLDKMRDTNLYITNLPREFKELDLDSLFGVYGPIVSRNILRDKRTNFSRGVAFVRFETKNAAETAIFELDGSTLPNCMAAIRVKHAEERGKQKAAYYRGPQRFPPPAAHQPQCNYNTFGGNYMRGRIHTVRGNAPNRQFFRPFGNYQSPVPTYR